MTADGRTIGELLAECSNEYTREQFDADRARLAARLCEKHGITEPEIDALIREHRYEHSFEDPEDEYMGIMTMAHYAGWLQLDSFGIDEGRGS